MKKFYLIGAVLVWLLVACGEAAATDPALPAADDLEIVTLTESSRGGSLYFDVVVKNTSDLTMPSASVTFSLLDGSRVVDSGSAFFENLSAGQEASRKAAFYDVLDDPGSYTCYRYEVTISPDEASGDEDASETESYNGTCN